jgi:ABC-type dipeptide/oligopeptide/nickel transport system permease component
MADAVQFRDLATVQAIAIIITAAYVLLNLGADIAVTIMNPRTRRQ